MTVEVLKPKQPKGADPGSQVVDWPAEPIDPFFNANSIEDIAKAERILALDERP